MRDYMKMNLSYKTRTKLAESRIIQKHGVRTHSARYRSQATSNPAEDTGTNAPGQNDPRIKTMGATAETCNDAPPHHDAPEHPHVKNPHISFYTRSAKLKTLLTLYANGRGGARNIMGASRQKNIHAHQITTSALGPKKIVFYNPTSPCGRTED